eukprot:3259713-Amphidinium_carterae.1
MRRRRYMKFATLMHLAPDQVRCHVHLNKGPYQDYATARRLIVDINHKADCRSRWEASCAGGRPRTNSVLAKRILALGEEQG